MISLEDLALGKVITEHYSDFEGETLVEKKPIKNWPKEFGIRASEVIINESSRFDTGKRIRVLVAQGRVGRSSLELLRHCNNLTIDHISQSSKEVEVLKSLLTNSKIDWNQQTEGAINEKMEYSLSENESGDNLLAFKNNSVNFHVTNLTSNLNEYDFILADFRHKIETFEVLQVANCLKEEGVLILGSIDDFETQDRRSLNSLFDGFVQIMSGDYFPHIYRQTRNKHQYAISYLSVWKKNLKNVELIVEDSGSAEADGEQTTADYYEDKSILESYDRFHFGEGLLGVKNFPLRMAEVCIEACKKFNVKMGAALDAGCGPGRTALELSLVFEAVEAYDYSQGFVDMMLKKKSDRNINNLTAYQGDSHKQEEICHIKKFDLIHGCNLIDRLHSPEKWVLQSKAMLNPGGLLVISSPYTWMEEHTPLEKWIGGLYKNGEILLTQDGLKDLLQPELELLDVQRIPFVIPDADGTFQYTYSNCTIFGTKK